MKKTCLNFEKIIGQHQVIRYIDFFIQNPEKLPTLSIFHGPQGTGKLFIVDFFSKNLLCHHSSISLKNNCNCISCSLFDKNQHPDYIFFPNVNQSIFIGDEKNPEEFSIRWLIQKKFNFKPYLKNLRIIVFPKAQLITHQAETAMLKTLEEPQTNTKFLFIVDNIYSLKGTIQSRGIKIKFSYFSLKEIQQINKNIEEVYYPFQGGSFFSYPISNELMKEIQNKVQLSTTHIIHLMKLENWLNSIYLNCESKYYVSFKDFLNIVFLVLIYEIHRSFDQKKFEKIEKIFEFKKNLYSQITGLELFLLGKLFNQLISIQ